MNDLSKISTYQAGVQQASVHRILQKHSDTILKPYGISKMQWMIIGTVRDGGDKGVRLTDLANNLNTTMSYITNAVNLLESKSILVRKGSSTDNRTKMISVSSGFTVKCEGIETALRNGLRKSIYAKVDINDFRIYMKVMYQLSMVDKRS